MYGTICGCQMCFSGAAFSDFFCVTSCFMMTFLCAVNALILTLLDVLAVFDIMSPKSSLLVINNNNKVSAFVTDIDKCSKRTFEQAN